MTSVSAGHIILTPTQPVGSGRPQRESNPEPPHQESRALPTELPRPPPPPPPPSYFDIVWISYSIDSLAVCIRSSSITKNYALDKFLVYFPLFLDSWGHSGSDSHETKSTIIISDHTVLYMRGFQARLHDKACPLYA